MSVELAARADVARRSAIQELCPRWGCDEPLLRSNPGCHRTKLCAKHGVLSIAYPGDVKCTHARFLEA
jgi:hypothetical protein